MIKNFTPVNRIEVVNSEVFLNNYRHSAAFWRNWQPLVGVDSLEGIEHDDKKGILKVKEASVNLYLPISRHITINSIDSNIKGSLPYGEICSKNVELNIPFSYERNTDGLTKTVMGIGEDLIWMVGLAVPIGIGMTLFGFNPLESTENLRYLVSTSAGAHIGARSHRTARSLLTSAVVGTYAAFGPELVGNDSVDTIEDGLKTLSFFLAAGGAKVIRQFVAEKSGPVY